MKHFNPLLNIQRRQFVTGLAAGIGLSASGYSPALGAAPTLTDTQGEQLRGNSFDLHIGETHTNITGKLRTAITVNHRLPAPTLRWREGERVTLRVTNHLSVDTSIHWHGMILPYQMDGVPGLSFAGIKPGETFTYQFDVNQSGTYWYHSHSGFQEQAGLYGAIVIDPAKPEPVSFDREHVVLLSDWSDNAPEDIYATLKKVSHYYNFNERTLFDLLHDLREKGAAQTWRDRKMWNMMRMSDSDLADVTGHTYTFLVNGQPPAANWRALFNNGEKVKLRFINASAMTLFDIRIPGLMMKVIAADGQPVHPVSIEEFRLGTAETLDVIVEPDSGSAYTIFCQSLDRSGYACATLASDSSLNAVVPAMDPPPKLGHREMGMGSMNHGDMGHSKTDHNNMNHDSMPSQNSAEESNNPDLTPRSSVSEHIPAEYNPGVDMRAEMPIAMLDDPGIGLRNNGRKVLTYSQLVYLYGKPDSNDADREITLHLTGNMSRYMWSFNGIQFADAQPLILHYGERVRINLVNDTMMHHPIHLHGLWSDLETGGGNLARKHTLVVKPGEMISYLVRADAIGRWAYHCHLLYHMEAGMFREVRVVQGGLS